MVYSRLGTTPEIDEDYFHAIQEAGQIYERMQADPAVKNRTGRKESSKDDRKDKDGKADKHGNKDKRDKKDTRQRSPTGRASSSKKTSGKGKDHKTGSDKRWADSKAAFQGIDQSDIDKYKKAKASCPQARSRLEGV